MPVHAPAEGCADLRAGTRAAAIPRPAGNQVPRLDELRQSRLRLVDSDPEVVGDVARSADAEPRGRRQEQRTLRVLVARRRCGQHVRRQHSVAHVVEAFEVASPTGRRDISRVEEPFEDGLAVRPAPPRASLRPRIAELRRGDRAPFPDLGQHSLDVARSLASHEVDHSERTGSRSFHPPAQEGMESDRHEGGHVAPVLEQLAAAFREIRERGAGVRPEAREQRELVGSDEHVHRVDLEDSHSTQPASDVAEIDAPRGPRISEPLRGKSDPTGRRVGDAVRRSADVSP